MRAVGHKRKDLCVNTSTTQKQAIMTPEIRFNMMYAQDTEVCLLNDIANIVFFWGGTLKLSQMYIHFRQVRIISITKFLFYI